MLKYVHSSLKFEKRLNALKTSEKMAVSAAKKADEIIRNIIRNGEAPLSVSGKFTKHGEWRIKNCIKFDIGKGYRMVCVKEKEHLFLLYTGTHDDCSAWVENNRNFTPDPGKKNLITYEILNNFAETDNSANIHDNEPDYEDILLMKITEKDLRIVFKGLVS